MKLLFDENLSPNLVDALADIFPESEHVNRVGMGSADDARMNNDPEAAYLILL